jgi:hypothetical protein
MSYTPSDSTPGHESIPRLEDQLPELSAFVRASARQIEAGELRDSHELILRIRDFYTADQMDAVEHVAPGWRDMSAYADGATLHHVTQALIVLQLLPEYRQAPPSLRALMEWIELYHDLGKQAISGQRDALHAFRGATMVARTLPRAGFCAGNAHAAEIDAWTRLVLGAAVAAPDGKGLIQDNRALPVILHGIERLFGAGSAAALIVEAVLLHHSLNVVPEWPNPASLTEAEIPFCIRPSLLPLLECVMLVDSDAWQLFDTASRRKFRQSTLDVFAAARRLVVG